MATDKKLTKKCIETLHEFRNTHTVAQLQKVLSDINKLPEIVVNYSTLINIIQDIDPKYKR